MTKLTDDERAARNEELKVLFPPVIHYINCVISIMGSQVNEVGEFRCNGHQTMEEAIMCHEKHRGALNDFLSTLEGQAQEIWSRMKATAPNLKGGVGQFRTVIVKETIEYLEEQPR